MTSSTHTSIPINEATKLIDDGGLDTVAAKFNNAVVFEAGDTLQHVAVGTRLLLCVIGENGVNKTPIDTSKKFNETLVVVGAKSDRMYMGPRTACKEIGPSNKQSAYMRPLEGSARSEKFFAEIIRVYDDEHYAGAVAGHAMHAAKALVKGADVKKGIMAKFRNRKVHTPIAEDDNGTPCEFKAQRKVFSARPQKKSGTDFDTAEIEEYVALACTDTKRYERGHSLDLMPVFYPDGEKCTSYDTLRSSGAAIMVLALRPDWVNTDLGNISWPHTVESLQLLDVCTATTHAAVNAPDFLSMSSAKRVNEDPEDGGVTDFIKRRKVVALSTVSEDDSE
ncbi:MAG: hypothetical protein VW491_07280 [Gammaproteobacteria bacterium]